MNRRATSLVLGLVLLAGASASLRSQAADAPILFFGDSITEGWMDAVKQASLAYPAVCDSLLRAAGYAGETRNLGRAGETTDDAVARIDADVLAARPSVVLIAFGSNDWYIHGYASACRVPLERFRANLDILVRKIRGLGARPVLLGLPPVLEDRYYHFSAARLYAPFGGVAVLRAAYDAAIAERASALRVPLVRITWDSADIAGLSGMDGLHPTAEAHRRIARALLPVLLAAREEAPAQADPSARLTVYPMPMRSEAARSLIAEIGTSGPATFHCTVFDARGRRVRSFVYAAPAAGTQLIVWDGIADDGARATRGMYLLVLESGFGRSERKFTIL
jgi:lysophospholipase L1-like esterase